MVKTQAASFAGCMVQLAASKAPPQVLQVKANEEKKIDTAENLPLGTADQRKGAKWPPEKARQPVEPASQPSSDAVGRFQPAVGKAQAADDTTKLQGLQVKVERHTTLDTADHLPLGEANQCKGEKCPPEKTRHLSFAAMGRFQPAAGKPAVADNPTLRARDPWTMTLPDQQEIRQTPASSNSKATEGE